MTNIAPQAVSEYLYKGISDGIKWLLKLHDSLNAEYSKQIYDGLFEALEWYKDNCIVSYTHLKNDFDELTKILQGKEMI